MTTAQWSHSNRSQHHHAGAFWKWSQTEGVVEEWTCNRFFWPKTSVSGATDVADVTVVLIKKALNPQRSFAGDLNGLWKYSHWRCLIPMCKAWINGLYTAVRIWPLIERETSHRQIKQRITKEKQQHVSRQNNRQENNKQMTKCMSQMLQEHHITYRGLLSTVMSILRAVSGQHFWMSGHFV